MFFVKPAMIPRRSKTLDDAHGKAPERDDVDSREDDCDGRRSRMDGGAHGSWRRPGLKTPRTEDARDRMLTPETEDAQDRRRPRTATDAQDQRRQSWSGA